MDVDPIKILHVFGCMNRGGAEVRTVEIMRNVDRAKYEMDFCVLSGEGGDLDEEIRSLGGRIHYIKLGRFDFAKRFTAIIARHGYSVIHSHVHNFSGVILWLAALAGAQRRIAHFRSSTDGKKGTLPRIAQRLISRWLIDIYATNILAVSIAAMEAAWSAKWRKDVRCKVIYNGIDLSAMDTASSVDVIRDELGIPPSALCLLHVGNFVRPKNHRKLIRIFREIATIRSDAYLVLLGREGGPCERDVKREVLEYGIASRVLFAGQRKDVLRVMRAADAMIFPSLYEGLPGAVLEACSAGLPVLASDLPVIHEIKAHLPLLNSIPLSVSDREWAVTCESMCGELGKDNRRIAAQRSFLTSPFCIDACVSSHEQLWRGEL